VIKVLITGAGGQLGSCILRRFSGDAEIEWVGLRRAELDVAVADAVGAVLDREKPDAVINAAAFTDVDGAEDSRKESKRGNVDAARVLARGCAKRGITLVHISTDYVFDGLKGGTAERPYGADDEVSPVGVYGETKAEGEFEVASVMGEAGVPFFIVRTGWLYDHCGSNFFKTMLSLVANNNTSLDIVADQKGTPTWTGSLAESLRAIVLNLEKGMTSGVVHYSDMGVVSWSGFAKELFAQMKLDVEVLGISTEDYPTKAQRPKNSHLDGAPLSKMLNIERKTWQESLGLCISEMTLHEEVMRKAVVWTEKPYDTETREIVQSWIDDSNWNELIDAFYQNIEFGTGGMRGVCGPGINRINDAVIARATQGLANYLKKNESELPSPLKVAIAFDSRHKSYEFAEMAARVLAGNDIIPILYPELRPTPQLSFTVIHEKCAAGIVITASHNPPEYNGYKVYYSDGAQIVAPHDTGIIQEVHKITSLDSVRMATDNSAFVLAGPELDEAFKNKVLELRTSVSLIENGSEVCLVYTGLHGTGSVSVPPSLSAWGFHNVHEVSSQAVPDGDFPTVSSPNPEEGQALSAAISLAESLNADLVMGTDPDADRVGLAVPNPQGGFTLLNGNETAALLFDYVLKKGSESGERFSQDYFIATTVVTTPLLQKLGTSYGVGVVETLTGFKHIAASISSESRTFIAGAEESYGYLVGDTARDKDAVSACCLLSELAHELKQQGTTMLRQLEVIHRENGVYKEGLVSVVKKGRDGAEQIASMMRNYRSDAPTELAGEKIVEVRDFLNVDKTGLPSSNVLQFITDKGSRITVRPSGTEPKIKYYVSVNKVLAEGESYADVKSELESRVNSLFMAFGA